MSIFDIEKNIDIAVMNNSIDNIYMKADQERVEVMKTFGVMDSSSRLSYSELRKRYKEVTEMCFDLLKEARKKDRLINKLKSKKYEHPG